MKKGKRIIVTLLVFAMLAGIGGTVLASNGSKQLTAEYRNISIYLDGKEVVPKDTTGKVVEPFIVDGTTYVPVRGISEIIGDKYVEWNAKEQNVYIYTEDPNVENETQTLYIYLTRHGETLFNEKNLSQGWVDSPLTETGWAQAEGVAKGLANVPFISAYSSTSERAMDTAYSIVDGRGMDVTLMKDLREMHFGDMEAVDNTLLYTDMDLMTNGFAKVGGESFNAMRERAVSALNQIIEENKYTGGNVLVTAHGITILMGMIQSLFPEEYAEYSKTSFSLQNCSVTVVKWEKGEFSLVSLDDVSYRDAGMK